MIEQKETLETLAEIAVAIAGFAALAGAIAERNEAAGERFTRLRIVVSTGLLLLLCALAPVILSQWAIPEPTIWRLSSLFAFALNAATLYKGIALSRSNAVPLDDRNARWIFIPTELLCQLALLAVIFQIDPERSGAFYLLFLYGALAQTSMIFLEFLDATFAPRGDQPTDP